MMNISRDPSKEQKSIDKGHQKQLVVISGPTGIGKTSFAIQLAQKLKTEIISADSRQFFRELKIGTASPTPNELSQAQHHFIGHLSILNEYNVHKFEQHALNLISELFKTHNTLVLVGGSGMYIDAVCNGIDDIPDVDPLIREEVMRRAEEENGIENLRFDLKRLDPLAYDQIDLKNPKRIIRALEVCLSTGKPFSSFKTNQRKKRDFKITRFVLNMDREKLYERIDRRVDQMIEDGLEEEARTYYPYRFFNALKTVGYTEFFDYFDEKIDYQEAVRLIKRNSRRYAKRQLSWFGRDEDAIWIEHDNLNKALEIISLDNI